EALPVLGEPVGVGEAARDLHTDLRHQHRRDGHPALLTAAAQLPERGATHLLHGQGVGVLVVVEIGDVNPVGVGQPPGPPRAPAMTIRTKSGSPARPGRTRLMTTSFSNPSGPSTAAR